MASPVVLTYNIPFIYNDGLLFLIVMMPHSSLHNEAARSAKPCLRRAAASRFPLLILAFPSRLITILTESNERRAACGLFSKVIDIVPQIQSHTPVLPESDSNLGWEGKEREGVLRLRD